MNFSFTLQKSETSGIRPSARYDHSAVSHDGCMFVFGGRNSRGKSLNDCFFLDLSKKNWTELKTKGKLPTPRYGHCAAVYNGQMFIYGGVSEQKKNDKEIYVLDLISFQWSKFSVEGEMPDAAAQRAVLSAPLWFLFGSASDSCAVNLETKKRITLNFKKKKSEPVSGGGFFLYNKNAYHFSGESIGRLDLSQVKAESDFVDTENYEEPKPDTFSLDWSSAETDGKKVLEMTGRTVHGFGRFGNTVAVYGGRISGSHTELLNSLMILSLPVGKTKTPTVQLYDLNDADCLAGHSTVQYGNSLFLFGGERQIEEGSFELSNDTYELLFTPIADRKNRPKKRAIPFWDKDRPKLPTDLPVASVILVNSDKWDAPASYFRAKAGQSNYLNWLELDYPDIRAYLKRGDIVENLRWSGDRSYGIQFYDGNTLVPVFTGYDEYGSISAEFQMFREFHPRYWHELIVDDRFAPGKKSQFYWHLNGICQIMDKKVIWSAAKNGVFKSEYGAYVIVNFQGLKYAVLKSCPKFKEGQLGFLYDAPEMAETLKVDFVVGPEL